MYYASFEEAFGSPIEFQKKTKNSHVRKNIDKDIAPCKNNPKTEETVEDFSNDDSINVKIEIMNEKIHRILLLVEKYERSHQTKTSSSDVTDKFIFLMTIVFIVVIGIISYKLMNEKSAGTTKMDTGYQPYQMQYQYQPIPPMHYYYNPYTHGMPNFEQLSKQKA